MSHQAGSGRPKLAFACQRGTDRWAVMLHFPASIHDEPSAGHPHITYTMPGVPGPSAPQFWRGGQDWAGGWHYRLIASFTDTSERPYARQLLDTLRRGVAQREYDLTYTWHQNGQTWTDTLDVSGFETAIAWLDKERVRPTPPRRSEPVGGR